MNIDWEKVMNKKQTYGIKNAKVTKNGIPFETVEEIVTEMNINDKKINPNIKEDRYYIYLGENGYQQIGIDEDFIPIGYWDIHLNEQDEKIKKLQKRD